MKYLIYLGVIVILLFSVTAQPQTLSFFEGQSSVTVGTQTEDGGVVGPDGFVYYPVDENFLHEPQKLCSFAGIDTGVRYRPANCLDKFTSEIIGQAGFKNFDNETEVYSYDVMYDILACNDDVFVDVFLGGEDEAAANTQEEIYSTTLDVGFRLVDDSTYNSTIEHNEFCIYVSDETVNESPQCFQFGIPECNDGLDNDGDGVIDLADPGCSDVNDHTEDPETTECQDGEDNDGDGLIDSGDPACHAGGIFEGLYLPTHNNEASATTQCQDGIDNDNDGVCDFNGCVIDNITLSRDPGCTLPTDNREDLGTTQCQDDIDNDGDGFCDYDGCLGLPRDPACFNTVECWKDNSCQGNKTINTEATTFEICDLFDDTIVQGSTQKTIAGNITYELAYTVYSCREGINVQVFLTQGTQELFISEANIIEDDTYEVTTTVIVLDDYSQVCFKTTDLQYGNQCLPI